MKTLPKLFLLFLLFVGVSDIVAIIYSFMTDIEIALRVSLISFFTWACIYIRHKMD